MARLRQVITRLEAELAAAREQLERQAPPREETATADLTEDADPSTDPTDSVRTEGAVLTPRDAVEEQVLSDEELDDPARTPETQAAPPAVVLQEAHAAARTLYDDSYTLFHEKSYSAAESGFRRFLELYPATELTDNAQFWIGECRFAQGKYKEALDAFLATVEHFPDGNKVPDAFYKAGKCLEALGDRRRAMATYEEAVLRFPSSAAAASAQERLAALR